MKTFLCAFEAVNLSNLFADCHDLSTTRGGGLAVLKIGDLVAKDLRVEPISSSASQGLLKVDGESTVEVETRVRKSLAGLPLLEHATIMVAACEAGEDTDGKFAQRVARLKTRMRWEQMRSPSIVYPKLGPKQVCDIDGVRPAPHSQPSSDKPEKEYLSDFTFARRDLGRDRKKTLPAQILSAILAPEIEVVSDLNKLADAPKSDFGNAAGKIAVLRFDGNDFAKNVEVCRNAAELQAFSKARVAEQEKFIQALVESDLSAWMTPDKKLRLEIVVYGGDEVTVITPAWLGWKALRTFYANLPKSDITYSGGLVFCHSNSPIHAIKKLANELTDKAKEYSKARNNGKKGNFAVYQTLESFDSVGRDLDTWMSERYPQMAGGTNSAILGIGEIGTIEDNMSHWKKALSKRKLHELAGTLAQTDNPWFADGLAGAMKKLLEAKGSDIEKLSAPIVKLHATLGNAVFLHILELWDYARFD